MTARGDHAEAMVPCSICGRPTTVMVAITGRGDRTWMCVRCWKPAPALIETRKGQR